MLVTCCYFVKPTLILATVKISWHSLHIIHIFNVLLQLKMHCIFHSLLILYRMPKQR